MSHAEETGLLRVVGAEEADGGAANLDSGAEADELAYAEDQGVGPDALATNVGGERGELAEPSAVAAGGDPEEATGPADEGHNPEQPEQAAIAAADGGAGSRQPVVSVDKTSAPGGLAGSVEQDIRRLDEIEADLAGIDAALQRLDAGVYGTCEVCGAAFGVDTEAGTDTLERVLLATRCPTHTV